MLYDTYYWFSRSIFVMINIVLFNKTNALHYHLHRALYVDNVLINLTVNLMYPIKIA